MYTDMQLWTDVRRPVLAEGLSKRQACRKYDLHWRTLAKILGHTEPPGYRRAGPRRKRKRKLELFLPIIHEILKQDRRVRRKQRHTAKRIFDRLRAEHGYDGGYTIVKDAVRAWRNQHAEVFMPLVHPPVRDDCPAGRANMTGGVNTQHDPRVRAGAMGVDRESSSRLIGYADRLDARAGGTRAVVAAQRLGFFGGGRYIRDRETRRRSRAEFKWETPYERLAIPFTIV